MVKRKIAELERVFERAVDLLQSSQSIDLALKDLLKIFAEAVGCEWGTYWKVDHHLLRPYATWSASSVHAPELNFDTRNRTLSMSVGTAGHVWRGRKPIWTTDLVSDMCLPRSLEARDAGLQGGVWFALKTDRAVYGVIELLGRNLPSATEELLVAVENLGIKLGRLIEEAEDSTHSGA